MAISFNEAYYLEQKLAQLQQAGETGFESTADVQAAFAASGLTAEQHYNQFGTAEGLNPSPEFNTDVYLNQKLAQLQADGEEGFETTADVLAAFQNAGLSPLEHYNQFGAFEAISPNNDFNAEFYLEQKLAQLQEAGETGFETTDDVLAAFQAAGLSPLDHYNQFGAFEALSPSNAFNTERYLADKLAQLQADEATAEEWAGQTTADLLASFQSAGLTPLEHFQQYGQDEGLVAKPVPTPLSLTEALAEEELPEVYELTDGDLTLEEAVSIADAQAALDAAQAVIANAANEAPVELNATYTLADSAEALLDEANADVISGAAAVSVNSSTVTKAQAEALQALEGFDGNLPPLAFEVLTETTSVNEGEAVSFQISGGQPNTEYVYKVTGVQAADIDEDAIAIVTTDENGEATITINVTADALTEGEETLNLAIVGEEATASVTVADASENAAPVVTADQAFDVAEDAAEGVAVGTVAATDADSDAVTYAIVSGNDAGYFAIDEATGEVTLTAEGAAALDAEADVTSYDLGVVAVDSKGATSAEQTVTVNVTDVNDNAPVLEAFEAASVEENTAAGAVVATAAATDADANDSLTYAITAGNDAGIFAIDAETGEITLAADAPSFEDGTTQFTLTVEASDGTNAVTQDLVVDLTDVNEAPVIENAETTAVDAADGGNDDQFLTQTATITDPESNFNGGSITIDVDGYILKTGALSLNGASFTLSGGKIIADSTVIEGDSDAFIGSYTLGGETNLDTDDGDTTLGVNQITITFDSDKVNAATVQELLRDIRISDPTSTGSTPADAQAKVTVTVADADGESASFSRVVDATGAMTVAGLNDDSQEIQVANAENVTVDANTNANFTDGGAEIDGMTITVTSSVAGDALHLKNETGAPVANQVRIVDNQLLYGVNDDIIGTVSGIDTDSVTFTLNGDATEAQIDDLLQQVQVDLDTDTLGDRTVTTEIVSGDGLDTITGDNAPSATLSLVGDFVAATVNGVAGAGDSANTALTLSTILAATDQAPVALNGNTYISVSGTYAAADIDQLIEDSALTVADGAVIRVVSAGGQSANLTAVSGLNSLGNVSFGTSTTPLTENLTITAAQADGNSGVVDADTITVTGVEEALDVNLSEYSVTNGGTLNATATLSEDVTFTGTLGSFPLNVTSNGHVLEVSAAAAAGKTIDSDGDINVTGVDGDFAGDLSKLDSDTAVNIAFDADTTLNADANLAATNVAVTVAQNQTLTLTNAQATAIQATGTVTGDSAVGDGNTGGSIAVTLVDTDSNQSGVQPAQFNLGALAGGDIATGAVNATRGQVTVAVDENTQIAAGSTFALNGGGKAQVTVANGVTLSGDAADLVTGTVTGAGNVTAALGAAAADLSTIEVTGEQVAEVATTAILNGATDLGDFTTNVAEGAELTLTAAQADGKTIAGADTTADGNNGTGGSIVVADLDATSGAVNLANITAGAASEQNDTAGTLTVEAQGDLDDDANLGDFQVEIASGQTLTLTEAQASGRVIGDATNTGNLTVVGLEADTDLSKVDINGNLIVNVAEGATVDASTNSNFGQGVATVGGNSTIALTDSVLTLTAAQASGLIITGTDGADDDATNDSQLIIAGDVAENANINLIGVAASANLSFGDDNAIAVATGATLTLTQAQADGVSITGDGDVVIDSFNATSEVNLAGITANATAELLQTATLASGTQLGTVTVEATGTTLTLNASQVGDAAFTGTGGVTILGSTINGDVLDYSGESWDIATLTVDGKQGDDAITGASDVTQNVLKGGIGDDELTTGTDSDELTGGDGIDTFNVLDGDEATITDFDVQTDYLNIAANGEATVSVATSGDANYSTDHVVNNGTLNINGTTGNDTITGTSGVDVIFGGNGEDSIDGGNGADSIDLTEGVVAKDTVVASDLADAVDTVSGADFAGAATDDLISVTNATVADTVAQKNFGSAITLSTGDTIESYAVDANGLVTLYDEATGSGTTELFAVNMEDIEAVAAALAGDADTVNESLVFLVDENGGGASDGSVLVSEHAGGTEVVYFDDIVATGVSTTASAGEILIA